MHLKVDNIQFQQIINDVGIVLNKKPFHTTYINFFSYHHTFNEICVQLNYKNISILIYTL